MNFEIIKFDDYRDILRHVTKARKISYRMIALESHIHTSYFSRVMSEKAEFSEEQIYRIGKTLGFESWEMDFFALLGSKSRNSGADFLNSVQEKIKAIRRQKSRLVEKLKDIHPVQDTMDQNLYYQEAVTARLHMYLSIPAYCRNQELLARRLSVSLKKLESELKKLESLGIISRKDQEIKILKDSLHLDEKHPVSLQNHKNWRIETLTHLSRGEIVDEDYHLSAVFTCDAATKAAIIETMGDAIVRVQGLVAACENSDEVHHIGLDIF